MIKNASLRKEADASKKKNVSPLVFKSLSPAKPTIAFDVYWRFAAERQNVFFARIDGKNAPWSCDPILSEFKFTNAYRASDRVSQYLIKDVIYSGPKQPEEIFFRVMLFKLFNKIETWCRLESILGGLNWETYQYKKYDKILSQALESGSRIYSAAYIMASGHKIFGVSRKHQSHLKLIELMIEDAVPEQLSQCKSMRQGFELLRSYPLIGDFRAYQLITDLNYSELTKFTEMEFTIPGPGARDGIRKCFSSLGGLSEVDIIRLMADRQEYEFERLGIEFKSLWGRRLQLIDIQNIFCEVDKYLRVKHPDIKGISGRLRIKQKFKENHQPIAFFYPPKWDLTVPDSKQLPSVCEI
ncbi:hypothetical protein MTYM_00473 [Methylococcales bacterium]|nr:hypothetical protein MTYM_00473 [Methylococcales bacterium]